MKFVLYIVRKSRIYNIMEVDKCEPLRDEAKKRGRKPKKVIKKIEEKKETILVLKGPIIVIFDE